MAYNLFHMFSRCSLSKSKISRLLIGRSRLGLSTESRQLEEVNKEETEEDIKRRILDASLQFVHTHGWSTAAIVNGAESISYPGIAHGMFPKGGFELIHHFYQISNRSLSEKLGKHVEAANTDPLLEKSEREVVEGAVEIRLRMILPYVDQWPQALAIMSLPSNATVALASLLTLVDDICYLAGDRSVDMTWYRKRLGLAVIYKVTELYMLQDGSEDKHATWTFLHRRMDEASQLNSLLKSSDQAVNFTKDLGAAAFITARNILGMNWNR